MHRRCSPIAAAVVVLSLFTIAQDKTPKPVLDAGSVGVSEKNEQIQRQLWFRDGRTPPSAKTSAAELLNRAQQQRQQLRALRRQQAATANGAVRAGAAFVNPAWQFLGPAPMVSSDDPSNFQDYGNVAGRVTAVVLDQSDATGNTVYVGAAYGGVWRSTNAADASASAVKWTALTDNQPTLAVGALGLSPDGKVLLVGTGEPNNSGDSYYGLGILRSANPTAASPTFTQITSTADGVSFQGVGFAHFAWNTMTTTNVVASVANTSKNLGALILPAPNAVNTNVGLFYSDDSGATWKQATVTDNGVAITGSSITGLVYNATAGAYFAAVRTHGIVTSTDNGHTWTRLPNQPGTIDETSCPATGGSLTACPLYRAELAVTPGRNEMFAWFVNVTEDDQGIFVSRDGGTTWTALGTAGQMASCGDLIANKPAGCDTEQGIYNLALTAIPTTGGTDLYAGAVNIFKCSLNATTPNSCNWLNTTHVYGCPTVLASLAHVHPDQHAIDFLHSKPDIMMFGNDGGVYRTLSASTGITTGDCTQHNNYENLNTNLALTQFVWFSHDSTADQILVGGTQDNGSPSLNPTVANASSPQLWTSYLGGDGGFTAIDPSTPANWFFSQPFTDIFTTPLGVNSRGVVNQSNPIVSASTLAGDQGAFYTPFMLDPGVPTKMLVGTCRVWRGNAAGGLFTAISNNFSTGAAAVCDSSKHTTIRALAAGGVASANGSQVIYAGTSSAVRPAQGRLFVTESSDGGVATWQDRTGAINPLGYQISSIVVDKNDLSGRTAFVTIMGFTNGTAGAGHIFRTSDAGTNWTDVTGDLPDAPADSFAIDPGDPAVWYVATDTGVFMSTNGGVNWTEYNPATGTALPNVAPTHLEAINTVSTKKLRVSTYGRGIWQADLRSASIPAVDFSVSATGSTTQTIARGSTATFTFSVAETNGFAAQVTFACASGLPPGATCAFSPASVAPGGTTTLTIRTAGANGVQQARVPHAALWSLALVLPGLVFIGAARRKGGAALMLAVVVAVLSIMPACGGGGGTQTNSNAFQPPPPPITTAVIVTATSGFVVHSTAVTLTVQ